MSKGQTRDLVLEESIASTHPLTHRQIQIALSGLMLGLLLAALDQTIVATALPTIVGDLGGFTHLSWVVTAYLLTSTVVTPLYGKLSDLYGRKMLFQFAIVVFIVGSALAGLSQNIYQLVAFRALQGIGGGGLFAMVFSIIGDIVPPRERGKYQGYFGAVFAGASVLGPLAGGFLTDQISWRWIFYVNLPVGILALFVTSVVLKLPVKHIKHRIDYAGSVLISAAVTAILLVTVWGGQTYAWTSPSILLLVLLAVILTAGFIYREFKTPDPILPLRLFRNRVFSIASGIGFLAGFSLFGAVIFLPEYMQIVRGVSPTKSGLMLIPFTLGIVFASVGSGQVISRIGRYKVFPVIGTFMLAVGFFLLSLFRIHTSYFVESLYMIVGGVGLGFSMQVIILATQNAVEFKDMGTATSAVTFFRTMGGAIGTSFFGNILVNRVDYNLGKLMPHGASISKSSVLSSISGTPAQLDKLPVLVHSIIVDSFVRSLHVVFLWAIPFAALAFILSIFLPEHPLRSVAIVGSSVDEHGESLSEIASGGSAMME